MAESTLNLKFSDLCATVGLFMGFGRGAEKGDTAWSAQDQARIEECVASGLRQFYIPKTAMGAKTPYQWSFLSPVATLTLAEGEQTIAMPDDFAHVVGTLSFTDSDDAGWWEVPLVGIGTVIQHHARYPDTTGRPQLATVRPLKTSSIDQAPRQEMHVFPAADAAYTCTLQYKIHPSALDGLRPYAYGGMAHAETIRAACLKAAEEYLDGTRGTWASIFEERLLASIGEDSRSKPALLGYNGDRSDWRGYRRRGGRLWGAGPNVTIAGVDPEL